MKLKIPWYKLLIRISAGHSCLTKCIEVTFISWILLIALLSIKINMFRVCF